MALIGCGRIGARLAVKALGLGLRVLAYDPAPVAPPNGVVRASLDDVLATSDFVSLHVPLTPETRGLIGEAALRKMKSTAYLVNTARGGLVDTTALVRALREGWLAGAALDVLPTEPIAADDPLLDLPNVVLTPHVAFYSEESLAELRRRTAQSVIDVLADRAPEHLANSEALAQLQPGREPWPSSTSTRSCRTSLRSACCLRTRRAQVERLAGGVSSAVFRVTWATHAVVLKQALPKLTVSDEWLSRVERSATEARAAGCSEASCHAAASSRRSTSTSAARSLSCPARRPMP